MSKYDDIYLEREAEIHKRFNELMPNVDFLVEAIETLDLEFNHDPVSAQIIQNIIQNGGV